MRTRIFSMTALIWVVAIGASVAESIRPVIEPLPDGRLWLPSTTVREEVAPVRNAEYSFYLAGDGGLALYDTLTAAVRFFRIPELTVEPDPYPVKISGMKIVGNRLWVAGSRRGLRFFDREKLEFVGRATTLGEGQDGMNLAIFPDPFTNDVWVSRFQHLDRFDAEEQRWINLDSAVRHAGFALPSVAQVLADDDCVWIAAQGGVLRFDRESRSLGRYTKELIGASTRARIVMPADIVVGEEQIWVFVTHGNGFNFVIAVFDKEQRTWTPYRRTDAVAAVDALIEALPSVRWLGQRNLAGTLRRTAEKAANLTASHPHYFPPHELRTLEEMSKRLDHAMQRRGLLDARDHGYRRYSVVDGRIMEDTGDGAPVPVSNIDLPQLTYTHLVGHDHQGNVLVGTSRGLAVIDVDGWRVLPLGTTRLVGYESYRLVSLNEGRQLVLVSDAPPMDGPATRELLWMDSEELEVHAIEVPDPVTAPAGRIGEMLAIRLVEGTARVYDPEKGRWTDLSTDRAGEFVAATEIPDELDLPGGARINLTMDGLILTPPPSP